jgi:hypothetical protein
MVLRDVATYADFGAVYSRETGRRLNISKRAVTGHLHKLRELGWIEPMGNVHCPFQAYRLPRDSDVQVRKILQHFCGLVRRFPKRFYFSIWYATLPSYYGQSCFSRLNAHVIPPLQRLKRALRSMPGRPGGASVPFGRKVKVGSFGSGVFWVPYSDLDEDMFEDVYEDVIDDFEGFDLFSNDFDVPEEFGLGDGFYG